MPNEHRQRLTKRFVEGLRPATKRYVAWDWEVSGFGGLPVFSAWLRSDATARRGLQKRQGQKPFGY
jgi:hypothetical protein